MIGGKKLKATVKSCMLDFDPNLIGKVSVDVRLGERFWKPLNFPCIPLYDLPEDHTNRHFKEYEIDPDNVMIGESHFRADPGKFFKAETEELFIMDSDIVGIFTLTSKLAQNGLNQLTSLVIRPGWPEDRAPKSLILELINVLPDTPLLLKPGMVIGQIHFFEVDDYATFF